ncbi:MAG TPA: hypothetical protein VF635_09995 [Propionibacteriaceae bacterium]|jgi:hypothetical protein
MTHRKAAPRRARRLSALAVSLLAVVGAGTTSVATADTAPPPGKPATVSADALPTWQVNGVVWAQVLVGNTVYVTGKFDSARPPGVALGGAGQVPAQNLFAYDLKTGDRVSGFNHSLNGQGLAITASPDGSRVFVGGDFTTVDGTTRNHVAAFDTATGNLTGFKANVNSQVRALAASNTTLYVGGGFQAVNSATANRRNLAAVTASSGSLLPWAPKADDNKVWSMVLAPGGSRVIVGGAFTTLSGQSAYGMGSLDASTGAVLPWAANQRIRNATDTGAITSLRTDGREIYGSGYAYGPGSSFEGTFAASPTTGEISVVNNCHGDTYDVLPVGPVLYSVGHPHDCRWVGSFGERNPRRWQYALAQSTDATRANTGPDNYGWDYDGLPASTVLHWFPQFTPGAVSGQTQAGWTITGNSSYIAIGGEFTKVNGVPQQGLVRLAVKSSAPNRRGPSYTTDPARPVPATTASSPAPGAAAVTFGTAWDYDNELLTYELLRDSGTTPVASASVKSNFWTLPTKKLTDTTAPAGSHTYRVRITDPQGNTLMSPVSNPVTVA